MTDSQRTTQPIVMGQSVLALGYKDGIMMTADTQLCYGNQQKFKNITRLFTVEQSKTLLGFSGEYSDVQHIMKMIEEVETESFVDGQQYPLSASEIQGYLSRVMYNRRNKMNPLWNQVVVAGMKGNDTPFLGYLDFHGTTYEDDVIATGFGAYFALPLLRQKANPDMSESEAKSLLEECMKILFARNCRGYNKVSYTSILQRHAKDVCPHEVTCACEVDRDCYFDKKWSKKISCIHSSS